MNPVDLQDPRIQKLIAALKGQSSGGPVFGGGSRTGGGGQGIRGRADFFRPGMAGINYNPLQAQMAQGAPGILGLNSGTDTNDPQSIGALDVVNSDATGQVPPVVGGDQPVGQPYGGTDPVTGTPVSDVQQMGPGNGIGGSGGYPNDPRNVANPYARRQGMFNGSY